jgi:hypothetical protein
VIVRITGETASESLADRVCIGLLESETVAVMLVVPFAVGVPLIEASLLKLNPAGKVLTDHL